MTELDNAFHNIISDIWSDMANINRGMEKEYKRLQVECQEWRKIAERLAKYFIWEDGEYGIYTCIHCDTEGEYTGGIHKDVLEEQVIMTHAHDCPIALYRQLVEKYGYIKDGE